MSEHDLVLVVDFGAQYAQLIARRVREADVYSEIVPHTMPVSEMLARNPVALILSGVPTFGICYGFQAMARALGGAVTRTGLREFGGTPLRVSGDRGVVLRDLPA